MNKERLIEAFKKNRPSEPMTEEETTFFFNIFMSKEPEFSNDINELDKESELYKHFKPLINGFQMQIFLKRLEHLTTLRITFGAFLLIALHLESAGSAVMHAFYLHHKLPLNTLVTTTHISMELFPWRFFSEEQLSRIWDAQKVRPDDGLDGCHCYGAPDNLLDYVEIWNKEE
jgi:hypothetical protein